MFFEAQHTHSPIHRISELAQELLFYRINESDFVMDATMGNGYDTLFLWKKVKPTGKVIAFDVQPRAIYQTKELLRNNGWKEDDPAVELILDSHGHFVKYVDRPLKAVMFNLGYLPGSDKEISTSWTEMKCVMDHLVHRYLIVGGYISIVSYSGHDEGKSEQAELLTYVRNLPSKYWGVMEITRSNAAESAPKLILIERKE